MIVSNYPFATLGEFKTHLKISNTEDDSLINQILRNVSGALEMAGAGRRLRRVHRQIETFAGGGRLLHTAFAPIAKIHSIRESSTRDFDTSGAYEELEEGTDFVLESGSNGEPVGESGIIRRLNTLWLGSKTSPGQVQVKYTAGYETDDEAAQANVTHTISSDSSMIDFGMSGITEIAQDIFDDDTEEINLSATTSLSRKGFLRVDLTGIVPLSMLITKLSLTLSARTQIFSGATPAIRIIQLAGDPQIQSNLQTMWNLSSLPDSQSWENEAEYAVAGPSAVTVSADSTDDDWDTILAAIEDTREAGNFIAFSMLPIGINPIAGDQIWQQSIQNTNSSYKPSLQLRTGKSFHDFFQVPPDLKQACIIQSVHEYKQRSNPGLKARTARGVAIASGIAIQKDAVSLLPEVVEIMLRYRRMY